MTDQETPKTAPQELDVEALDDVVGAATVVTGIGVKEAENKLVVRPPGTDKIIY